MNHDERLNALKILSNLLTEHNSLSQLLYASEQISPLTKEICFGFCRHYFRLQAIANQLLKKKPKEIEIWVAVLMGLYQLQYLHMPDYAVVHETVALLEKIKKGWAKALVNAVLRNFCRQRDAILKKINQDPEFIYGHPQWLVARLKKDWPNNWEEIIKANDEHPPMTLRVNKLKTSPTDYLLTLSEAGIEAIAHPIAADAVVLKKPTDVKNIPGFFEGTVSVQDAAAQIAASLLSLEPGQRVLDACCAPGGKTGHILETEPQLSACIALDVDSRRLAKVKENLDRLNLSATLVQGDAQNPEAWWDGQLFDRILLDAPCSAIGVIRRHPDIKLLRTREDIIQVSKIQTALLKSLWPLLAEGGLMVYATCSIMAEENERQIAAFVATHPECQIVRGSWSWGVATTHGQQILPGEQGMDGFFYSVLQRK